MRKINRIAIFSLIMVTCLAVSFAHSQQGAIPTPESIIGFQPGEDYKLANWDQISRYFIELGKTANRVEVHNLGPTEMGNPMLVAYISSPQNLSNKDKIKEIQHKLADPRKSSDSELPALLSDGKTVVLITASLHANEVGASQMAPILAHQLATDNSPVIRDILENTFVVFFPSANPDGVMLMANHYMKHINEGKDEAPSLPRVYNKYVGHDNNRDWYMLTQKESKMIANQMYDEWLPEIVFDMHQMGNGGARFFLPPFADPLNPLINPLIVRQLQLIGGYFSTDLVAGGYPWVQNMRTFSMWWHGGMRTAPYFHNMVGILSEAASANLATPIPPLSEWSGERQRNLQPVPLPSINYPVVWDHERAWHLSDIIEQDRIATIALLKAAARNKDMFLSNYYKMNKQAIVGEFEEQPFAYVMPANQHDPGAMVYFLGIMMKQATEFYQATSSFTAGGKTYPAGSVIAYLAQPARAHVESIFGTQQYPERLGRPYDIVGWTLPLQMGVQYDRVDESFTANTVRYEKAEPIVSGKNVSKPKAIYVGANSIDHYRAVNVLMANKHNAEMLIEPYEVDGQTIPAGSFVFKRKGKIEDELAELKTQLSLNVIATNQSDKSRSVKVKKPKIGMIDDPRSMPIGWMRWLLEKHQFDYELIYTDDLEAGNLNKRFDAILVTTKPIKKGAVPERRRGGRDDISETDMKLKEFAENGGTLISWAGSTDFTIRVLGMDVQNPVPGLTEEERRKGVVRFNIPGSVLKINVDTNHPVTYGMQEETYIFFRRNNAWNTTQGKILGRFPNENPLVSGYIKGEDYVKGTPTIVYDNIGKGKVVLINFEPMFRAQPVGTFKLVFNSILYSTMPKIEDN